MDPSGKTEVPLVPAVPYKAITEVPLDPELPDVPEEPEVPLAPDVPLVPD